MAIGTELANYDSLNIFKKSIVLAMVDARTEANIV